MKKSERSEIKATQKTVLLTVSAVALVALVAGGILMWNNYKKNQGVTPVETQATQGTDVFGNAISSYVGDVGTIKYDMSACTSLADVMKQITEREYKTPVGNVVVIGAGKYADDATAAQAIDAAFGTGINKDNAYFVHVRLVQTATTNQSWIDNHVSQSLVTLVNYEASLDDGISKVNKSFTPMYVDDSGRWSIASSTLTEGQVRDAYYVAYLNDVATNKGDLTIAVGPNDEIGLTYYVYSMTYGSTQGLSPEQIATMETAAPAATSATTTETTVASETSETSESALETTQADE
jgi:DNA-binding NarL/FixJ family response regulator